VKTAVRRRLRRAVFAVQNCRHEADKTMIAWEFTGRVVTGLGQGASFTSLDWARSQFLAKLGVEPWPGTLNLLLESPAAEQVWREVRTSPGILIEGGDPGACDARAYPVLLAGTTPGAIIYPEVPGYPENQVEIISALPLRQALGLGDGDLLTVQGFGRSRIHAAVFDVDGTLINSIEGYRIAAARAAAPFGYEVTWAAICNALNYQTPFWDLVIPEHEPRDADLVATLHRETLRHWPQVLAEHVAPFPGLRQTLTALRDAGVRLGIYTGSRGESFAPLHVDDLLDVFEVVITGNDVGAPKPHPEGLLRCLECLGVHPSEAAYIGDSAPDMAAGRAAGTMAVGVLTGAGDSAALTEAGAHRIVADHAALMALFELD
jgi:HAD superfamily hydrolase (TIGR01509 family)